MSSINNKVEIIIYFTCVCTCKSLAPQQNRSGNIQTTRYAGIHQELGHFHEKPGKLILISLPIYSHISGSQSPLLSSNDFQCLRITTWLLSRQKSKLNTRRKCREVTLQKYKKRLKTLSEGQKQNRMSQLQETMCWERQLQAEMLFADDQQSDVWLWL